MTERETLQINGAENTSLLFLLHPVPVQPKRNPSSGLSISQSYTYTLPLDKERGLAGTLAFISSIRDDTDHIPAVCTVEELDSNCMILLAVNRVGSNDGTDILRDLKQGFDKIFNILAGRLDGERDTSSTENEVFTTIVSMCTSRILSRLGLIPGRKRSKKSVKDKLSEAINCTRRLVKGKNTRIKPVVMSFITAAKELMKLTNSWCSHQTTARLESLLEGIHRLYQQQTFHETLRLITDKDMVPSARRSLVNMISKCARYREATRFLVRTAKKFPIVRRARVETIILPQDAFQRFSFDKREPQLLSTILRIAPNMNANNLSQIWHLLQITQTEAARRFSQQTKDTLQQAKIHAEVQLIFHCDLRRLLKFPRVIASSKDACYLCNALLSIHGIAHAPRSHGRIYPGWRLPSIPHLSNLERRLNCYLEAVIKDSLSTMLSRQKRIIFPFPQESTLLTLPISDSTLESVVPGLSPLSMRSEDSHSSSTRSQMHENQGHGLDIDSAVSIEDIPVTEVITGSDNSSVNVSSDSNDLPVDLLCPGTSLTKQMKSVSPLYTAGSLEVQIECDGRSRSVDAPANGLLYTIEWLTAEVAKKSEGKCHSRCVIVVESLNTEASHTMCNDNTLYMATRDSVIRLEFHSKARCVE